MMSAQTDPRQLSGNEQQKTPYKGVLTTGVLPVADSLALIEGDLLNFRLRNVATFSQISRNASQISRNAAGS